MININQIHDDSLSEALIGSLSDCDESQQFEFQIFPITVNPNVKQVKEIKPEIELINFTLPETCSICYVDFQADQLITITRCRHLFHQSCLREWFEKATLKTCPFCRGTPPRGAPPPF